MTTASYKKGCTPFDFWLDEFCNRYDRMPTPHEIWDAALPPKPAEPANLASSGWLEAEVAWEVCASIHEKFAKGKDALYSTRHADFVKHASDCRAKHVAQKP